MNNVKRKTMWENKTVSFSAFSGSFSGSLKDNFGTNLLFWSLNFWGLKQKKSQKFFITQEASFPTAEAENSATTSPPHPAPAPPPMAPPVGSAAVSNPELDRRRQNHQLLRQLNGELKELQKRAKMKMEDGDDVDVWLWEQLVNIFVGKWSWYIW